MELENNLRILKLYPSFDVKYPSFLGKNYNYHVNYGVWDKIAGDKVLLVNMMLYFYLWLNVGKHHLLLENL